MKILMITFLFLGSASRASEMCENFSGVQLNGFVGSTISEISKSTDCNDNIKLLKFNTIEGQNKADYCSCVSSNPKSLSARSLASVKATPSY